MATKIFSVGAIVQAYTHILLTNFDDVYHVFNHLTQDDLFTHQLLVAGRLMEEEIARQHPWVAGIDATGLEGEQACHDFVADLVTAYGPEHPLESAEHLWVDHSPMKDLADIWDGRYKRDG